MRRESARQGRLWIHQSIFRRRPVARSKRNNGVARGVTVDQKLIDNFGGRLSFLLSIVSSRRKNMGRERKQKGRQLIIETYRWVSKLRKYIRKFCTEKRRSVSDEAR
jgi:hypothetical protein